MSTDSPAAPAHPVPHHFYNLEPLVDSIVAPYQSPASELQSTPGSIPSQSYIINGHRVVFRHLQRDDVHKGYLQLLGQLTKVSECTAEAFSNHFDLIFSSLTPSASSGNFSPSPTASTGSKPTVIAPPQYFILVAEDQGECDAEEKLVTPSDAHAVPKVIGTATILIEHKFIRNFGSVGHIEDVVVDRQFRRCGIGLSLVNGVADIAKRLGAYKAILDCDLKNCDFYSCNDFEQHGVQMSKYY